MAANETTWTSVGLLVLRLGIGGMMIFGHGWAKVAGYARLSEIFPDPIGLGPTTTLVLAIVAEVGCSALLVLGLGTRVAAIPLLATMLVAAFVAHADDPWAKKELALLYAVPALTLLLAGGGRFALDRFVSVRFRT